MSNASTPNPKELFSNFTPTKPLKKKKIYLTGNMFDPGRKTIHKLYDNYTTTMKQFNQIHYVPLYDLNHTNKH